MKKGDIVFVRRRYDGGYWMGEIDEIIDGTAVIFGTEYTYSAKGYPYGLSMRKKLKEEDLFYKQWAYWEK